MKFIFTFGVVKLYLILQLRFHTFGHKIVPLNFPNFNILPTDLASPEISIENMVEENEPVEESPNFQSVDVSISVENEKPSSPPPPQLPIMSIPELMKYQALQQQLMNSQTPQMFPSSALQFQPQYQLDIAQVYQMLEEQILQSYLPTLQTINQGELQMYQQPVMYPSEPYPISHQQIRPLAVPPHPPKFANDPFQQTIYEGETKMYQLPLAPQMFQNNQTIDPRFLTLYPQPVAPDFSNIPMPNPRRLIIRVLQATEKPPTEPTPEIKYIRGKEAADIKKDSNLRRAISNFPPSTTTSKSIEPPKPLHPLRMLPALRALAPPRALAPHRTLPIYRPLHPVTTEPSIYALPPIHQLYPLRKLPPMNYLPPLKDTNIIYSQERNGGEFSAADKMYLKPISDHMEHSNYHAFEEHVLPTTDQEYQKFESRRQPSHVPHYKSHEQEDENAYFEKAKSHIDKSMKKIKQYIQNAVKTYSYDLASSKFLPLIGDRHNYDVNVVNGNVSPQGIPYQLQSVGGYNQYGLEGFNSGFNSSNNMLIPVEIIFPGQNNSEINTKAENNLLNTQKILERLNQLSLKNKLQLTKQLTGKKPSMFMTHKIKSLMPKFHLPYAQRISPKYSIPPWQTQYKKVKPSYFKKSGIRVSHKPMKSGKIDHLDKIAYSLSKIPGVSKQFMKTIVKGIKTDPRNPVFQYDSDTQRHFSPLSFMRTPKILSGTSGKTVYSRDLAKMRLTY